MGLLEWLDTIEERYEDFKDARYMKKLERLHAKAKRSKARGEMYQVEKRMRDEIKKTNDAKAAITKHKPKFDIMNFGNAQVGSKTGLDNIIASNKKKSSKPKTNLNKPISTNSFGPVKEKASPQPQPKEEHAPEDLNDILNNPKFKL